MPISVQGLGMATNATQNLAQLIAGLGAQQGAGLRAIGDTARQIQQDAARRKMAEAAQAQRQQQIDMQQAQMLNAQMAQSRDRRVQEEQRQAFQQYLQGLQPQGQALPGGLPANALQSMMANLHAQKMQSGQQAFQGEQAGMDRGLSRDLAAQREGGMDRRQTQGFEHQAGMQERSLGAQSEQAKLDRIFSAARDFQNRGAQSLEARRAREARAAEGEADRASAEKIAGMRTSMSAKPTDDPGKAIDESISQLRKRIASLQDQVNKPGRDITGEEAPPNAMNRQKIQSTLDAENERLIDLLIERRQAYEASGQKIPAALDAELNRLMK